MRTRVSEWGAFGVCRAPGAWRLSQASAGSFTQCGCDLLRVTHSVAVQIFRPSRRAPDLRWRLLGGGLIDELRRAPCLTTTDRRCMLSPTSAWRACPDRVRVERTGLGGDHHESGAGGRRAGWSVAGMGGGVARGGGDGVGGGTAVWQWCAGQQQGRAAWCTCAAQVARAGCVNGVASRGMAVWRGVAVVWRPLRVVGRSVAWRWQHAHTASPLADACRHHANHAAAVHTPPPGSGRSCARGAACRLL